MPTGLKFVDNFRKLGRGYTVEGLTVTYMPRSPGGWTADSIQQRARFFGYHRKHLGFCRIYLHPNIRAAYAAYVSHEDDLRSRLGEHRGKSLKDWKRIFYLDRSLQPTRRNVLLNPFMRPRLSKGWYEPRSPHMSPVNGSYNHDLFTRTFEGVTFVPHSEYPQNAAAVASLKSVFESFLIQLSYLDDVDSLGLCAVNCNIASTLEANADARCCIYYMSYDAPPRSRGLTTTGHVKELFQGRSSAKEGGRYPGDRQFFQSDMVSIQIHILKITTEFERETGTIPPGPVVAVAVRFPGPVRDVLIQPESHHLTVPEEPILVSRQADGLRQQVDDVNELRNTVRYLWGEKSDHEAFLSAMLDHAHRNRKTHYVHSDFAQILPLLDHLKLAQVVWWFASTHPRLLEERFILSLLGGHELDLSYEEGAEIIRSGQLSLGVGKLSGDDLRTRLFSYFVLTQNMRARK